MQTAKHRTQISLDDWQYQILLDVSQRTKKSFSSLIRELITERFTSKPVDISHDPMFDIIGIGNSGHKNTAQNHDSILYGNKI